LPERRLIDATELFAAMPADVLDALREHSVVRTYERNQTLFHQGDLSHDLFVVQSGRIAIAAQSGDGRESVVAVLEAGGLFGELGLFDDAPRSADARALTDTTVIALEYEPVREVLRARPEVLWVVLRILARNDCGRPTRRWPTRCSSTSRRGPPSASSSSPATRTRSRCRSPRRSSRRWSARPANG
jgi:hypothetical protein